MQKPAIQNQTKTVSQITTGYPQHFELSPFTNYLLWNMLDQDYLPSCISIGFILQICKVSLYRVALTRHMDGRTDRQTDRQSDSYIPLKKRVCRGYK